MFLLLPPMNAISRPLPASLRETDDQRVERQAACFRELAELNMDAARIAHRAIVRAEAAGESAHKPTLDLARATRSVTAAIRAENDPFRPDRAPRSSANAPAPRAPASDTRRTTLCTALLKAAKAQPDPARRAALNRDIPVHVEATLVADPDAQTSIGDHFFRLADHFHLALDLAKLPDELLGMPPRIYVRDG